MHEPRDWRRRAELMRRAFTPSSTTTGHAPRWVLAVQFSFAQALSSETLTMPAGRDPLEGTPYRTLLRLGEGGMVEVYEVEHVKLGSRPE